MARVSFIDLDPEEEDLFFSNLTPQDRFTSPRITQKVVLISKKRIKGLTQRSLLPQVAEAWGLLTAEEKSDWGDAASAAKACSNPSSLILDNAFFGQATFGIAYFGKNVFSSSLDGWRLFVQDKIARIKNGLSGNATPSLLHQSWVGYLYIEAPATEIKIAQYHPREYWISQKVYGKKGMYSPVEITEDFSLPLDLSLSYKSDLVSQGAGSFAKFYAVIRSSYQGVDRFTNAEISLDLSTDWKSATVTLPTVQGYVIGYTLYFHLYNLRGTLWCDNISAVHSGQNWVRDPYCNDLFEGFTRAFYQVPKHWVYVENPAGSEFGSIYPT